MLLFGDIVAIGHRVTWKQPYIYSLLATRKQDIIEAVVKSALVEKDVLSIHLSITGLRCSKERLNASTTISQPKVWDLERGRVKADTDQTN